MRFGSVCSGIEAASVAWRPLGWRAAWLSEIEPFPSAVLKHHYPDVPNLGDMTALPKRIMSGEVEAPDLFCGGTPCQAFSVAGLRNSLNDARGNLSLTFCEIANAIDKRRTDSGLVPAIIFWENVPGVLNTKDNAFGCFLGALAGEDDPLVAPGGRWTNAGCVYGPQRTIAWRVLDAQYFGVAQRRRRVFVVASARDDFDPAAVLFESEGVRRDIAPSREAGQETTGTLDARTNGGGFPGTDGACARHVQPVAFHENQRAEVTLNETAGALGRGGGKPGQGYPAVLFESEGVRRDIAPSREAREEVAGRPRAGAAFCDMSPVAGTLTANAGGMNRPGGNANELDFCVPVGVEIGPSGGKFTDLNPTLDARAKDGPIRNQLAGAVIALQDVTPREKAQNGKGWSDDGTAYTVDTHATQGVAQPIAFHPTQDPISSTDGTTHSLGCGSSGGQASAAVAQPMAFQSTADCLTAAYGTNWNGNASATNGSLFATQPAIGFQDDTTPKAREEGAYCLRREAGGEGSCVMTPAMQVRRLTPVECERLQGFPDNYTNIPWRGKPDSPDGPRYKALGNSWAVPVVRWIGSRIKQHLDECV